MRQTIAILIVMGTILITMAFSNLDNKSVGAVGDVKYSVLPPDKFIEKNGKGWVLMDDKISLTGSDLGAEGILELPDARGMFIRGLNLNRNDDKADPFSKENNRERPIGDFQMDAVGKHTHSIDMRTGYMLDLTKPNLNIPHSIFVGDRPAWGGHYATLTATDNQLPITETRPKNIALYIYVKINE